MTDRPLPRSTERGLIEDSFCRFLVDRGQSPFRVQLSAASLNLACSRCRRSMSHPFRVQLSAASLKLPCCNRWLDAYRVPFRVQLSAASLKFYSR